MPPKPRHLQSHWANSDWSDPNWVDANSRYTGFSAPEFQCLRGGVVGRPRRYLWSLRSEEPFLGMQPTSQASLIIRISRIDRFRPSEGVQSFPAHFPRWILKLWRWSFACCMLAWCCRVRRSAFFDFHSWCRAHVSLLRATFSGLDALMDWPVMAVCHAG